MRGSSFKSFLIAAAVLGLAGPFTSRGALLTIRDGLNGYAGTVDTHLRQASPTTDASANVFLQTDMSDGGLPQHALLRFDNIVGAGPNQIPANQMVNTATLVIRSTTDNAQSGGTISFHRILIPWNETDTWTGSFGDNGVQADDMEAMAVADGSYVPNFANPGGNPANTRQMTLDVTAAVQAWVNGSANYGWVLLNSGTDGYRFDSSENAIDDTNNPALIVDYGAPEPPTVTSDPVSVTVGERGTASFTVAATGSLPFTYQWFYNGATMLADGTTCVNGNDRVVSGATGPTLTIANVQLTDAGMYHCVVGNGVGSDPSASANLSVNADTNRPTILYFHVGANLNEFIMVLSEPLNDSCQVIGGGGAVSDTGNWIIEDIGGASLGVFNYTNMGTLAGQTVLGFLTSLPHDPLLPLKVTLTADLYDTSAAQNVLTQFTYRVVTELAPVSAMWRYNDQDIDPGPNWFATDPGGAYPMGPGPFDAKRDGGVLHANGLDDCRVNTLYDLGPVGTCLSLQSPVTVTNLRSSYFWTHFTFAGDPNTHDLLLLGKFDDGGVAYLNGVEKARVGMLAAPAAITHTTLAARTVGDGDLRDAILLRHPPELKVGDNLLATSLHQVNLTSSDLTMGFQILSIEPTSLVRVSIAYSGANPVISWAPDAGQLEYKNNLSDPTWTVLSTSNPYTDTSGQLKRFYRVSAP